MNEQLTKQLQAFFSSVSDVDLVYLFGSRVDADIGPMSDYDLGVLVSNTAHPEAILSCLDRGIKSTLGIVSVDLVLLGDAPVELAYAIIAQGVCVYQKDITMIICRCYEPSEKIF
jgi:predicted nucleotidyltransferase